MRVLLLIPVVFLHVAFASKIHIYGSDDAPITYSPEAVFTNPMVVIFHASVTPSFYRVAVVPAGLKDDLLKTDPAFQDLAKVIYADDELSALYADMTKFENDKIFDIPLAAGDNTIVASSFKVASFLTPTLPLMFITHPKQLESFEIKNVKHFGEFDLQ